MAIDINTVRNGIIFLISNKIMNEAWSHQKAGTMMQTDRLTFLGYSDDELSKLIYMIPGLTIKKQFGKFPMLYASSSPKEVSPYTNLYSLFSELDARVFDIMVEIGKNLGEGLSISARELALALGYPEKRILRIAQSSPLFRCAHHSRQKGSIISNWIAIHYEPKTHQSKEGESDVTVTEADNIINKIRNYCWKKQVDSGVSSNGYDNRLPALRGIANSVKIKHDEVVDLVKSSKDLQLFDNQEVGGTTVPIKTRGSWRIRCLSMPNREKLNKLLGSVKCLVQVYETSLKMVEDIPEVIGESYVSMAKSNIEDCIVFLEGEVERIEDKLKEGSATPRKPFSVLL